LFVERLSWKAVLPRQDGDPDGDEDASDERVLGEGA
jgi:hypothetical protein